MDRLVFIIFSLFLTSCSTVNMSMAHTQGSASDVIDEVQSAQQDIRPDLDLDLKTSGI